MTEVAGTYNIESMIQKLTTFGDSITFIPSCRGKISCVIGGSIPSTERRRHEMMRALTIGCFGAGVAMRKTIKKILHD